MSFQTWSATQLYVHFGVYCLYPLHTRITGLTCSCIHYIQLSFLICINVGAYKTYNVPKFSKLGTKTLFVSFQTIVCALWTTWFCTCGVQYNLQFEMYVYYYACAETSVLNWPVLLWGAASGQRTTCHGLKRLEPMHRLCIYNLWPLAYVEDTTCIWTSFPFSFLSC